MRSFSFGLILLLRLGICFGQHESSDIAIGPKFSSNHDVAIELTIYDLMIGHPGELSEEASKWAFTLEGTIYRRGAGKQFGAGVEYLLWAHKVRGPDGFPWNVMFPNPQFVVNSYSDGDFGLSASLFFVWIIIPFYEYDFKERENRVGVYLKAPILYFGQ